MKRVGWMILTIGSALLVQAAQADWTPTKRLTWNAGSSENPAIAVDPFGNPHIVWKDGTPGNEEIFYNKSTDGGATWATNKRLTWTSGSSGYPAIAIDLAGDLHVVFHDDTSGSGELYHRKSTDGGATWATSRRLTWTEGDSWNPAIAIDSLGGLHVVWEEEFTTPFEEIAYKKSTDGGATWTTSRRLTWAEGGSWNPAVTVDSSGILQVVWSDETSGNTEVYYKKSTDGGLTWAAAKRLTWNSGYSWWPTICVYPAGTLHVVWEDSSPGNHEVYYRKSTDGGTTWASSQRLTWTSGSSSWPTSAVDTSGNLHVVWSDTTPGVWEIYYLKSTDGGGTWATSGRLTWTSGSSLDPAMAVDSSGNLHIAWGDWTPGNLEVYYMKGK